MKNIFILLGIFASFGVCAQKYVPFPTENAEWKVLVTGHFEYWGPLPPRDVVRYYDLNYYLDGDTVIDSKKYIMVYEKSEKTPYGFYREEGKKIYYRGKFGIDGYGNDVEQLLYDFTKEVGDTIVWNYGENEYNNYRYVVTKIDSIKIDGQYRKRYTIKQAHLSDDETDVIIEGIGSVKNGILGRFALRGLVTGVEYFWDFKSFSQNGKTHEKCDVLNDYGSISFAPIGSVWYYDLGVVNQSTNELDDDYLKLQVIGDEMKNGKLCCKTGYTHNTSICISGSGYVYENHTNDTVFYAEHDKFIPIYCWNAEAGDSWSVDLGLFTAVVPEYQHLIVAVDSVKCVNVFDKILREQYVSYFFEGREEFKINSKIIQGIGDVSFFYYFKKITNFSCDELTFNRGLRCFVDPVLGTYKMSDKACDYHTDIEKIEIGGISVFYNDKNNIVVSSDSEMINAVSIYNFCGQNVRNLTNLNLPKVSIKNLSKGIFIIQIVTENGYVTNKKVVVR